MSIEYVRETLKKHYSEAADGLVDKPPSKLLRGEGTEKNFYIMKVDLVGSTRLLEDRWKSTYLKLVHTYLSTVDKISQDFGADGNQVEYAGDSVQAYFPELTATAEDALSAACHSRAAVMCIQELDSTLKSLQLKCKVVLHFGTLVAARIGPRASNILTAIGLPLHEVAKIEKKLQADQGWATNQFFRNLQSNNKKYLSPVYQENYRAATMSATPPSTAISELLPHTQPTQHNYINTLQNIAYGINPSETTNVAGLLNVSVTGMQTGAQRLGLMLTNQPQLPTTPMPPATRQIIGYRIHWPLLCRDLGQPN
jgi:class 3 adenylate cyclase